MTQPLAPKRVSDSAIHDQTAIVFPNDLNTVGTLFGGRVLEQADRVAAVVSHRHAGRVCVTLGVDSVRFLAPARRGDILIFQAAVNRVWRSSMEVGVKVLAEDFKTLHRQHIFSAYFTFVAVDDDLRPVQAAGVLPETPDEIRRYEQAELRRQDRLKAGERKRG
ncbi:MAG TPA: acyl-CoA thioesterase [Tepidisphaeraceae bacterium]|jgi:acyl-CoA hydrolase|nr:acyl-CoA thioesterase [Tepidisphaeraceae bacterium]